MTSQSSNSQPLLSVSLTSKLFPDGAKYDVDAKDQFQMFSCTLVNNSSDQTYRIETWGTPLMADEYFQPLLSVVYSPDDPSAREVLKGDYFHIAKRSVDATDYITLAPGESSDAFGFRLIDIFRIQKAGLYSVQMTCHFRSIEVANSANPNVYASPITNHVASSAALKVQMNVTGTPTSVQVFNQLAAKPAQGAMAPKDTQGTALKPPIFTKPSTDTKRRDIVTRAHYAAYYMARTAVRALTGEATEFTSSNLDTWFGTHTNPEALRAIKQSYQKIVDFMEAKHVIYDFSHPDTADTDNDAYVTGIGGTWDDTIYVGAGFWQDTMQMIGPDSRAGTLVHELAHGVDMAQDFAEAWYGSGPTKRLAKLNPQASIMHADAIGRFSECVNPFAGLWKDETGKNFRFFSTVRNGNEVSIANLQTESGETQQWLGVNIFGELAGKYCFLYCYANDDGYGGNGYLQPDLDTIFMYLDQHPTHKWTRRT